MFWLALKRAVCAKSVPKDNFLLGGGVLGHGLGALRHGVLGKFTGEEQADSRLDLPRGDGGALVVVRKAAGLGGDALENVVHERVHDGHGLAGDSGVGVDLLEHLVDVDAVGFLPALLLLLVALGDVLLGLAGLLGGLSSGFRSHFHKHGGHAAGVHELSLSARGGESLRPVKRTLHGREKRPK